MKQRITQRGIKTLRRKAGRALLLALLLIQPAWAVHLCNCQTPAVAESTACHATQAPPPMAHHCAEAETPVAQFDLAQTPPSAMRCCDLTAEAETPATLDAPPHPQLLVATTLFLPFAVSEPSAKAHFNHQSPPATRPLYLAYSCLLI